MPVVVVDWTQRHRPNYASEPKAISRIEYAAIYRASV